MSKTADLPSCVKDIRRKLVRLRKAEMGKSMLRSRSPGCSVLVHARDEFYPLALGPCAPKWCRCFESRGRKSWRRAATCDVAADRRCIQILKEASSERQHWRKSSAASQSAGAVKSSS